MRLTEHFGPCGIGWGCDEPVFSIVPAGDEILVFCTLACWYMDDGKRATVYGIGGDKILVKQQSGLRADDEAYKKAFTDALGNAFKHVGSGADVHMGLFEDSKYKAEVAAEFAEEGAGKPAGERSAAPPPQRPQPVNGHAAPTSAPPPPPNPEEPPEVAEKRRAALAHFWTRNDYGIDPAVIQGGIGRWDAEFLALAEAAPNLDALLKLKEDNKTAGFVKTWESQVASPVIKRLRERTQAAEKRLNTELAA
jgi:hypothetical protein